MLLNYGANSDIADILAVIDNFSKECQKLLIREAEEQLQFYQDNTTIETHIKTIKEERKVLVWNE